MKSRMLVALMVIMAGFVVPVEASIDDVMLKEMLENVSLNRHSYDKDVNALLAEINYASNRLVAAAKKICSDENSSRQQKVRTLVIISRYGTLDDVPFLESMATNRLCWRHAVIGIINRIGSMSNAVSKVSAMMRYPSMTNMVSDVVTDEESVVGHLVYKASESGVLLSDRSAAWDFAMSFASNNVVNAAYMDWAFITSDPNYAKSRRRLNLLRHQLPFAQNDYLRNYVLTEIGKLEALPADELLE